MAPTTPGRGGEEWCEGEGWWRRRGYISCEYVKSQRASRAELELPFPFCLADNFPPMIPDPRRTKAAREPRRTSFRRELLARSESHIDTRYLIIPRN